MAIVSFCVLISVVQLFRPSNKQRAIDPSQFIYFSDHRKSPGDPLSLLPLLLCVSLLARTVSVITESNELCEQVINQPARAEVFPPKVDDGRAMNVGTVMDLCFIELSSLSHNHLTVTLDGVLRGFTVNITQMFQL